MDHFDQRPICIHDQSPIKRCRSGRGLGFCKRARLRSNSSRVVTPSAALIIPSSRRVSRPVDSMLILRSALLVLRSKMAGRTYFSQKPLRHDTDHRRGNHKGLYIHIQQPYQPADTIFGVKCCQDFVPCQSRLDGNFCGKMIADFPDDDNIGVLPQNMSQCFFVG